MILQPSSQAPRRAIALIMVMMVIVVLGILAGGFAYSIKVETKLARNANFDSEFEWLGRSGVEFARYFLGQHMLIPNEGAYDALNQKWAGGPLGTNDILGALSLEGNQLGQGTFSLQIIDLERYYNINLADDTALRLAMDVIGVDAATAPMIVDSILDWRDTDDNTLLNGAESDFYLNLAPPYPAKNGPIDDLAELLRIRGMTPQIYDGTGADQPPALPSGGRLLSTETPVYAARMVDLFTPMSARLINVNTASNVVLRLIPGIDENMATAIVRVRAGPDGVEGTDDDMPFRTVGELINVPGISAQAVSTLSRLFTTRSATFKVTVTVELDSRRREFVAILRRNDPRDVRILLTYWK